MKKVISVETFVPAPRELVFDVFTHHETYRELPVVKASKLLSPGIDSPSNGQGAIREIQAIAGFGTLKEKVVSTDRPHTWDYQFLEWPLPFPHGGGRMRFETVDGGTLVHWDTSYELTPSLLWKASASGIALINKALIKSLALMMKKIAVKRAA